MRPTFILPVSLVVQSSLPQRLLPLKFMAKVPRLLKQEVIQSELMLSDKKYFILILSRWRVVIELANVLLTVLIVLLRATLLPGVKTGL